MRHRKTSTDDLNWPIACHKFTTTKFRARVANTEQKCQSHTAWDFWLIPTFIWLIVQTCVHAKLPTQAQLNQEWKATMSKSHDNIWFMRLSQSVAYVKRDWADPVDRWARPTFHLSCGLIQLGLTFNLMWALGMFSHSNLRVWACPSKFDSLNCLTLSLVFWLMDSLVVPEIAKAYAIIPSLMRRQ